MGAACRAPELTPEASEAIAEYYADLRNSQDVKALPVTVGGCVGTVVAGAKLGPVRALGSCMSEDTAAGCLLLLLLAAQAHTTRGPKREHRNTPTPALFLRPRAHLLNSNPPPSETTPPHPSLTPSLPAGAYPGDPDPPILRARQGAAEPVCGGGGRGGGEDHRGHGAQVGPLCRGAAPPRQVGTSGVCVGERGGAGVEKGRESGWACFKSDPSAGEERRPALEGGVGTWGGGGSSGATAVASPPSTSQCCVSSARQMDLTAGWSPVSHRRRREDGRQKRGRDGEGDAAGPGAWQLFALHRAVCVWCLAGHACTEAGRVPTCMRLVVAQAAAAAPGMAVRSVLSGVLLALVQAGRRRRAVRGPWMMTAPRVSRGAPAGLQLPCPAKHLRFPQAATRNLAAPATHGLPAAVPGQPGGEWHADQCRRLLSLLQAAGGRETSPSAMLTSRRPWRRVSRGRAYQAAAGVAVHIVAGSCWAGQHSSAQRLCWKTRKSSTASHGAMIS